MDLNILIGGPQGGGIETAGLLAVRSLAICGLEVFADREYHSNIKGKHSYAHIRASDKTISSIKYPVDILGALDVETLATHYHEVMIGGFVVHDSALSGKLLTKIPSMYGVKSARIGKFLEDNRIGETVEALDQWMKSQGMNVITLPFSKILVELLKSPNPLIERAMNTAVTSAVLSLMGITEEATKEAVEFQFKEKREVLDLNAKAVESVYYSLKTYVPGKAITKRAEKAPKLLVAGNDSVAIGKILGGLRLQTYYPITPAADESFTLEQNNEIKDKEGNVLGSPVVVQTEDEIAAIAMAIGGALAGVRSATSTSGPGFSLMVEGLGWAGNNEVPVVITMYQRGGPSTGLPTRHSQSDLLFSIFAGHGEFARLILASGDHAQATADAAKCLNYAEEYQLPVIHLLDKGLANCITLTSVDFDVGINRGKLAGSSAEKDYKRFKFTDDGISARAFLGNLPMWYTGDEHDEFGHIIEDPVIRDAMYEKRMAKSQKIIANSPDYDKAILFGPDDYEDLIITWGVSKGAAVDALGELNDMGRRVAMLQIRMMEPFPSEYVMAFLRRAESIIAIEANYVGLLADLVEAKCQTRVTKRVVKYNGRLISQDEIVGAYKRVGRGESRVVLTGGE
ncbi:MAG: 2-oxoacid:acceptor oxidoreductase subunit alpha [Candidatus Methanomethylicus sp.]|nr:2-oxoacid:acceptor oxidoreductase subunit alpha [Candidatus Methanomethylicus sp.]